MPITLDSRIARTLDQVFTQVGDGLVAFHGETGKYIEINDVGAAAWELLEQPTRVSDVSAALQRMFEVSPEQCDREVLMFLRALETRGFVVVVA